MLATASSESSSQVQSGCVPWLIQCRDGKAEYDNQYSATQGICGIAKTKEGTDGEE
jgi:hypothetical protein